ncbi:MAG: cytochrome-c peroxidase [Granulosicoccaceae bacterium]
MYSKTSAYLFVSLLLLSGCDDDLPNIDPSSVHIADVRTHIDALPVAPAQDPAKVELGRLLFWDPILSANQDVACASCHHPDLDYADGAFASLGVGATGLGHQRSGGARTPRNAQTILNTVYNGLGLSGVMTQAEAPMFWDNRISSLEQQARQPILSEIEMRGSAVAEDEIIPLVLSRLERITEYNSLFAASYASGINEANMLDAIASFERSLVANNSAFDQFMRGDRSAMSDRQIIGLQRFIDFDCTACHNGPMLSDYKLHVLGAADHAQNPNGVDTGAEGNFSFRTPSLRNLLRTGPYMHGGTRTALNDVINFYEDLAGGQSHNSQVPQNALDPLGTGLPGDVDDAAGDIVAFLGALDDANFDRDIPDRVPSGLPVGGAIRP